MKHTILGYNQAKAYELGLNIEDLCLIRWFEDFINTGKMQVFDIDGETYYWVKYDYIVKQLPIIADNKRKITTKMKRLVDLNLLDFYLLRKNGNYSLYKLNEKNHRLLEVPITEKSETLLPKEVKPITEKGETLSPKEVKPITEKGETLSPKEVKPITEKGETLSPKEVKPFTEKGETNINLSNINLSDNSSNKKYTGAGDIDNYINLNVSNDKVKQSLYDFLDHRETLKKPMNSNMFKLFVEKLNRYDDNRKIELINDAIINGWKDIYPRDDSKKYDSKNNSKQPLTKVSYDLQEAQNMWNNGVPSLI